MSYEGWGPSECWNNAFIDIFGNTRNLIFTSWILPLSAISHADSRSLYSIHSPSTWSRIHPLICITNPTLNTFVPLSELSALPVFLSCFDRNSKCTVAQDKARDSSFGPLVSYTSWESHQHFLLADWVSQEILLALRSRCLLSSVISYTVTAAPAL